MKAIFLIFSFLVVCLFSSHCFSRQVELRISAKWIKGELIKKYKANVITSIGKEITLPIKQSTSKNIKVKITASDQIGPQQSVYLNNQVFELKNNRETLITNPQVIALMGKESTIYTESSTGEFLELTIIPVRYIEQSK
jgi:hypothetical protein